MNLDRSASFVSSECGGTHTDPNGGVEGRRRVTSAEQCSTDADWNVRTVADATESETQRRQLSAKVTAVLEHTSATMGGMECRRLQLRYFLTWRLQMGRRRVVVGASTPPSSNRGSSQVSPPCAFAATPPPLPSTPDGNAAALHTPDAQLYSPSPHCGDTAGRPAVLRICRSDVAPPLSFSLEALSPLDRDGGTAPLPTQSALADVGCATDMHLVLETNTPLSCCLGSVGGRADVHPEAAPTRIKFIHATL